MHKILVLSDVHGNAPLLERILKDHSDVDMKIYLGDFQMSKENQKYYSTLFDYVVTGNCDYPDISPITEIVDIYGKKVFITHGHYFGSFIKKIDFDLLNRKAKESNCEIILNGHDHVSVKETKRGITRFNPGSTTYPRNTMKGTYGIITIRDNGDWEFNHIIIG